MIINYLEFRFVNVISGNPVHVLYLQLETCKVVSIRSLMEMKKMSGVEDKTDIPRISSKTWITNCKPN